MERSKPTEEIDITTCPICLEEFKTPKCLPCLHSFCETCLNLFVITALKSESKSQVGKSQFDCPVCRGMVTPPDPSANRQEWAKQFPFNHFIVSLMDQNKQKANLKLCDPCKSMGDVVKAVSWCHDCNEALCEMCVNVHKKLKISREHILKNINDLDANPPIVSLQTCEKHKGKSVEAYCRDHNQPCCTTCVAIHHRKCDHVTTLEEAADGILESKDLLNLLKRLNETSALNKKTIKEIKDNIKTIEDKKCDIQKELQDTRQRIMDTFDKFHATFMHELTQKHNRIVQQLTNRIIEIENKDKVIQNYYNMMNACRIRSSKTQVLLEMTRILEREREQMECLEEILAKHKRVQYEFTLDDVIKKIITKLQTVGQMNIMEKTAERSESPVGIDLKECIPQVISSFSIKVKCKVDAWVHGGCFTTDNTLLLSLCQGRKLAIFNGNGDLIKQSADLSRNMCDVCILDPNTAVVTRCLDNVVDFINISTLTVNKSIALGVRCWGIASSDNKLYIGCDNKLLILDKHGNKEKEIKANSTIFGVTIINKGEKKIVYTERKNNSCHFIRSSDLQQVKRFTHPYLQCPRDVTSDREGNVYITGESSGNVLQVSSEGILIRVLINGLDDPRGIQFDGDTGRFFISYSYPAKVNIYNMVKP